MTADEAELIFTTKLRDFCRAHRTGRRVDPALARVAADWEIELNARLNPPLALVAAESATLELAPAEFQGWQEGFEDVAAFPLFRLTKDIAGHPVGSSVSAETLTKAGYAIPAHPAKPTTARARSL